MDRIGFPPLERIAPAARGFTLIEVLVTIAVATVLILVATPSFESVYASVRTWSATSLLTDSIAFARSEALRRDGSVVLCRTREPNAPVPACNDDAADWSVGWITFAKSPANATLTQVETGDEVLARQASLATSSMSGIVMVEGNGLTSIPYGRYGIRQATAAPAFTVDYRRGGTASPQARCVRLPLAGLPGATPLGASCP